MAIVGFSQGTMMALQVGLKRRTAPAAIVGYSGMFVGAADLANQNLPKPFVLLVHGSADPIVPVSALQAAKADLENLGIRAAAHVSAGLGHSVDLAGLRLGLEFITKGFGADT